MELPERLHALVSKTSGDRLPKWTRQAFAAIVHRACPMLCGRVEQNADRETTAVMPPSAATPTKSFRHDIGGATLDGIRGNPQKSLYRSDIVTYCYVNRAYRQTLGR